jgi:hypothetical protein
MGWTQWQPQPFPTRTMFGNVVRVSNQSSLKKKKNRIETLTILHLILKTICR